MVSAAERQPDYAVTSEPVISTRPQDRVPLGGDGRVTGVLKCPCRNGRPHSRSAREGIRSDSTDPSLVIRRRAQLLISYADSPIVEPDRGGRAPDANWLTSQAVSDPMRSYTLLGRDHTTLLHAGNAAGADDVAGLEAAADAVVQAAHGRIDVYLVAARDADVAGTVPPLIRDADGDFARNYDASDTSVFVIRPDGYLGIAARGAVDTDDVVRHLKATFRWKLRGVVAGGRCGSFAAELRNAGEPRGRRSHR